MFLPRLAFASLFIVCCFTTFAFGATLPHDEVEALKSIGRTLGKTNWNFDVDPCSGHSSWVEVEGLKDYNNTVTCNCSFADNTICHVVNIWLTAQNLSGTLPPELVRLPFLQQIDLSRNYLSGKIPKEWGSMSLVYIALLGNRLTGLIPQEFANISTLTTLIVEENQLSGTLPAALGDLPNIEKMQLSCNNFSGELPTTFARLTTMKDFRIADTNFTGKIPDFIFKNWTKLEKLFIQASGLSGPIPDIIALQNLTVLRISDLNGGEAPFPRLALPKLTRLILRSCYLIGPLPASIWALTKVEDLDLGFNRLSGEIPSNPTAVTALRYLFLNGNMFSGRIPSWIFATNSEKDLSYNNFSDTEPGCERNGVNLFASTPRINNSGIVPCLGSPKCPAEPKCHRRNVENIERRRRDCCLFAMCPFVLGKVCL